MSFTNVSFWLGLVAFLMYQNLWCCKMNRCGIITAGVFAFIAGAMSIILGFLALWGGLVFYCDFLIAFCLISFPIDETMGGSFAIVGGVSWVTCAVCTFVFGCGHRYHKYYIDDEKENHDGSLSTYPISSTVPNTHTLVDTNLPFALSNWNTANKVISYLPDGTIKIEPEPSMKKKKKKQKKKKKKPENPAKYNIEEEVNNV